MSGYKYTLDLTALNEGFMFRFVKKYYELKPVIIKEDIRWAKNPKRGHYTEDFSKRKYPSFRYHVKYIKGKISEVEAGNTKSWIVIRAYNGNLLFGGEFRGIPIIEMSFDIAEAIKFDNPLVFNRDVISNVKKANGNIYAAMVKEIELDK